MTVAQTPQQCLQRCDARRGPPGAPPPRGIVAAVVVVVADVVTVVAVVVAIIIVIVFAAVVVFQGWDSEADSDSATGSNDATDRIRKTDIQTNRQTQTKTPTAWLSAAALVFPR